MLLNQLASMQGNFQIRNQIIIFKFYLDLYLNHFLQTINPVPSVFPCLSFYYVFSPCLLFHLITKFLNSNLHFRSAQSISSPNSNFVHPLKKPLFTTAPVLEYQTPLKAEIRVHHVNFKDPILINDRNTLRVRISQNPSKRIIHRHNPFSTSLTHFITPYSCHYH